MTTRAADLPLVRRFRALAALPRAAFCDFPTPVERVELAGGGTLLVKRDDRTASPIGGNKARGLEWLLGGVRAGDRVVTVGPTGSNHALATATYAATLGARTTVVRWRQDMNAAARAVDARLRELAAERPEVRLELMDARFVGLAYAVALLKRAGARWIPAGGAHPLAILGHVNAGMELAAQVRARECETPSRVYVPLGTGGTAAGLALGFRIAGLQVPVVPTRVVPRILGRAARVATLANRTAALIERFTGEILPRISPQDLHVEHGYAGAAYGRPLPGSDAIHATMAARGILLDDTYTLKTCAAAVDAGGAPALLWLTFDGRILRPETRGEGLPT